MRKRVCDGHDTNITWKGGCYVFMRIQPAENPCPCNIMRFFPSHYQSINELTLFELSVPMGEQNKENKQSINKQVKEKKIKEKKKNIHIKRKEKEC